MDVVTLHSRDDWFAECKASIPAWCNHIIVESPRPCLLGPQYAKAFSLAETEYVSWVDDDDIVEQGALEYCQGILRSRPDLAAVWTSYVKIDSNGCLLSRHDCSGSVFSKDGVLSDYTLVHQLVVARSSLVKRTLPFVARATGRGALTCLVAMLGYFGGIEHVPIFGYRWRQHDDNHHSKHQEDNRILLTDEFYDFYSNRITNGRPVLD